VRRLWILTVVACGCGLQPFDAPRDDDTPRDSEPEPPLAGVSTTSEASIGRQASWSRLAAPTGEVAACRAYWTGSTLLLWSADPACVAQRLTDDRWTPMSDAGAPMLPDAWAGTAKGKLVVYGYDGMDHATAVYDPDSDSWSRGAKLTLGKAPHELVALSADDKLLLWGGYDGELGVPLHMGLKSAKYDPEADAWQPLSEEQMPAPRYAHGVGWDSQHMFVVGGSGRDGDMLADAGLYDEGSNAWEPIPPVAAPSARLRPAVAWSGYFYVVFGGTRDDGATFLGDGGVYCPEPCWAWQPMSSPEAFAPRHPQALWTGEHVVVMQTGDAPLALARYFIDDDRWEAVDAPAALADFVVIDLRWDLSQHRALLFGRRASGEHALWAYHPPFVVDPGDGHPGDNLSGNQTHP
jgi:hypothetical protein